MTSGILEPTSLPDAPAADIDVTEKQLERVRSDLSRFYGYHQGPKPRIGMRVRNRRRMTGTVVAHDKSDQLYVRYDDGTRDRIHMTEYSPSGEPRRSLHDLLRWFSSEFTTSNDVICVAQLANHFRGDNGARYANRPAYLWCVDALCHLGAFGRDTPKLATWLKREIGEADPEERAKMPPPMDAMQIEKCAHEPSKGLPDITRKAGASLALLSAMDHGRESIELATKDAEQELDVDVEGLERCLAMDIAEERQVVILGRTQATPGPGLVDVVDLDSLSSYTRHISGLDISGDAMDPGWFWDVITQSSLKHPKGATAGWWGSNLQGPEGIDVDEPERRRVGVFASLILMRYAHANKLNSTFKRHFKRARELSRTLDKRERGRLAAVAPELVSPETSSTLRISSIDTMAQHLRQAVEMMLDVLPVPEPADGPTAPIALSHAQVPAESDVGVVPESALVPAASRLLREKVTFTAPAKVLRFSITEHLLLGMEWRLVDDAGAHAAAVGTGLEWLEQRLSMSLPKHWSEGAHEIERSGVSLQIEASPSLFAFRLEHPDMEHPTRWWRVEVTVLQGRDGNGGMVGLRMQVRDLVHLPPPIRTVPALVRAWAAKPGLFLAGARAGHIAQIRTEEQLERLHAIIHRRGRETPVWVVPTGGVRLPMHGPLAGLGRAVIVDPSLVGYSERYAPLTPDVIHIFPPQVTLPKPFNVTVPDWLDQLRTLTLDMRHNPQTPSFRDVRDAVQAYRIERAAAPTPATRAVPVEPVVEVELGVRQHNSAAPESWLRPETQAEPAPIVEEVEDEEAETDIAVLSGPSLEDIQVHVRRELREFEELLELAETERDQAAAERDSAQAEAMTLRHALERVRSGANVPMSAQPTVPEALSHLPEWARSIAPRVAIADKALRLAAKTPHNEVGKIYASLKALAELYWVMRFSDDEGERESAHEGWRRFLQSHRLRWSAVGKAAQTGRYEDEYTAIVDGKSYTASWHVAGSSAFDPLRCLRIYLDIDTEGQRLVITHLPTHLTNSLT